MRTARRTRSVLGMLTLAVLLLSSCAGSSDDTEPTAAAGSEAAGLPKPEKTTINLGVSATTGISVLVENYTYQQGFYKKYGLDVEMVYLSNPTQTTQAMIAGRLDAADNSAGPVISSLATDHPLVMANVIRDNLTDVLATSADVKSAADLKGQSLGISSFGSQSHACALLALKELGLTDKDVTLTTIGDPTAVLAAIRGGGIASGMQKGPNQDVVKKTGFNILVDLAKVNQPGIPRQGLVVSREFAEKNPNTVLALVAAQLDGLQSMFDNRQKAIEILAEGSDMSLEDAKVQVDYDLAEWRPRDGRPDKASFDFTKEVLLRAPGAIVKDVDVNQAYTTQYVDKLRDLGFF